MCPGSRWSPDRSRRDERATDEIRRLFARYRRFAERPPLVAEDAPLAKDEAGRKPAKAPLTLVR